MPRLSDLPDWARPREVADVLGVSRRTISNWLRLSKDPLPGARTGLTGRWRIPRDQLEEWCRRNSNYSFTLTED